MAALVRNINREIVHRGAEVALPRDLYRASQAGALVVSSCRFRGVSFDVLV
jgi:hypothetical protein